MREDYQLIYLVPYHRAVMESAERFGENIQEAEDFHTDCIRRFRKICYQSTIPNGVVGINTEMDNFLELHPFPKDTTLECIYDWLVEHTMEKLPPDVTPPSCFIGKQRKDFAIVVLDNGDLLIQIYEGDEEKEFDNENVQQYVFRAYQKGVTAPDKTLILNPDVLLFERTEPLLEYMCDVMEKVFSE